MGLFDEILSAVSNPNQQGNAGELGNVLGAVQQISNSTGADPSTMQSVLGIVGNYVRSSLQEKQATEGDEAAQAVVNQYGGTSPNSEAVDSLLSPFIQQEIGQVVQERTGLDAGTIQQFLPMLVPIVLHLLKFGSHSENPESEGNPVLNSFLQGEGGSDFNIGSVVQLASRFLGH